MSVAARVKVLPRDRRPPPIPPPRVTWHAARRAIQAACVLAFVALPFFDVLRVDIPRQRFYVAGHELWINEFGIVFFTLMLLMFVIAAVSMLYGRLYCSFLCPQMIFSEASLVLEQWLRKRTDAWLGRWSVRTRRAAAAAGFYAVVAVASVFLSFVFISYFVEPRDVLARIMRLDLVTAGGVAGASTMLFTFLDFAFVRERFCTTVCPYGYLQGMLSDHRTLLVSYDDPSAACIECGKCVRVCHMGIDIRASPHQIECIHCGECIDACRAVLGRLGQPTLIDYRWGAAATKLPAAPSLLFRLGLRDAKRVVVLLVLLFYAGGLAVALSVRQPVLVRLSPDRSRLSWIGPDGEIINRFRLIVANRGDRDEVVGVRLSGLPRAELRIEPNPFPVMAGEVREMAFEVAVPADTPRTPVTHISLTSRVVPAGPQETFETTFLMSTSGGEAP